MPPFNLTRSLAISCAVLITTTLSACASPATPLTAPPQPTALPLTATTAATEAPTVTLAEPTPTISITTQCTTLTAVAPTAGVITANPVSFAVDPSWSYAFSVQNCPMRPDPYGDGQTLNAAYTLFTDPTYQEPQGVFQPEIKVVPLTPENQIGYNGFIYAPLALLPDLQKVTDDAQAEAWFQHNALNAQPHYLASPTLTGARGLVVYAQDIYFFTNSNLLYAFDGITHDGRYYVGVRVPLDAPFLLTLTGFDPIADNTNPNAIALPGWPSDYDGQRPIIEAYNAEAKQRLNAAPTTDFTPDLAALDALVMSLQITTP